MDIIFQAFPTSLTKNANWMYMKTQKLSDWNRIVESFESLQKTKTQSPHPPQLWLSQLLCNSFQYY